MKKIITATLILSIFSCSNFHKVDDLTLCKKGWQMVRSNPKGAVNLFNQCIKDGNLTTESLARTYRNIGIAYNQMKEYESAIEYFNKAIALNPDDVFKDYINRGNSFDMLKQSEKALESYNKAIASNGLCDVFEKRNKNHITLNISSDCGEIYYNRGIYFERQKDYKSAKEDFKTAYKFGLRSALLAQRFIVHNIDMKDLYSSSSDKKTIIDSRKDHRGVQVIRVKSPDTNNPRIRESCTRRDLELYQLQESIKEANKLGNIFLNPPKDQKPSDKCIKVLSLIYS